MQVLSLILIELAYAQIKAEFYLEQQALPLSSAMPSMKFEYKPDLKRMVIFFKGRENELNL